MSIIEPKIKKGIVTEKPNFINGKIIKIKKIAVITVKSLFTVNIGIKETINNKRHSTEIQLFEEIIC